MNLTYLLFLACPIGMGLMMWMMMRGNGQQPTQNAQQPPAARDLAGLHQQLQSLERQQLAIRDQINRLREEATVTETPPAAKPAVRGITNSLTTAPNQED